MKHQTKALVIIFTAAAVLKTASGLSLISEKCDPNKVGPDETTVKGGWQAEMFNGLSFRACGEYLRSRYCKASIRPSIQNRY